MQFAPVDTAKISQNPLNGDNMKLTDEQLLTLINSGYTDEQILTFAHENTKPADLYGAAAQVVTDILHQDPIMLETLSQNANEMGPKAVLKMLEKIIEDSASGL